MWLFPELMRLLRPTILERARPGTRVLTSTWDLGSWKPDKVSAEPPPIYMWIVPGRVAGGWEWQLNLAGQRVDYAPCSSNGSRRWRGWHAPVTGARCSSR